MTEKEADELARLIPMWPDEKKRLVTDSVQQQHRTVARIRRAAQAELDRINAGAWNGYASTYSDLAIIHNREAKRLLSMVEASPEQV